MHGLLNRGVVQQPYVGMIAGTMLPYCNMLINRDVGPVCGMVLGGGVDRGVTRGCGYLGVAEIAARETEGDFMNRGGFS